MWFVHHLRTDIPRYLDFLRRKILTNISQYQGFTSSKTLCRQAQLVLFYGSQSFEVSLGNFLKVPSDGKYPSPEEPEDADLRRSHTPEH